MTHYRANFSKLLRSLVIILSAVFALEGCTKIDSSLGENLLPNSHEMRLGEYLFAGPNEADADNTSIFSTKLYITDSIRSSIISYGYFGRERDKVFGARKSGFFTQYLPGYELDEDDVFGYLPIYDSMMLYLTPGAYSGDTTLVQKFYVYEVVDDSFVTNSADSVFFCKFDMSSYINTNPLYEFYYPNQDDPDRPVYMNTTELRLMDLPAAEEFVERLMLKSDGYDVDLYDEDNYSDFLEKFKGLYIAAVDPLSDLPIPADEQNPSGAIYSMDLSGSGFGFYGRSRSETDATIVQDTIGMTYLFYNTNLDDYEGAVSINTVEHDHSVGEIDMADVKTLGSADTAAREGTLTSTLRVAGMAGVVSEISINEDFFTIIDEILSTEVDDSGEPFNSLFFNQARLNIYLIDSDYDSSKIAPMTITPWLNIMPTRLGLYTRYAHYTYDEDDDGDSDDAMLEGIADYPYYYETVYGYTLGYGGYLNRSLGCYEMNIEAQIQAAWNSYLEAKETAGGDISQIDWTTVEDRVFYLAPIAESLFSARYATLQGMQGGTNNAPMRLKLTYTMIK